MYTVLLTIHIILAVLLIGIVLMQRSEGGMGSMGGGGGGGSFMSARGTANALTRATAIIAFLFMCTNISLIIMSGASPNTEKSAIVDMVKQQQSLSDNPVAPLSPDAVMENTVSEDRDAKDTENPDAPLDSPAASTVPEVPVVTE